MTDKENTSHQQAWRQRQIEAGNAPLYCWISRETLDRIDKLVPKDGSRSDVIEAAFTSKGAKKK